jgi:FAD/FMN-containing dehydrogenase
VPVLPRGGGTALAGQTVGAALVLDFSKYMNRCWRSTRPPTRPRAAGAAAGPAEPRRAPHGLQFGPDPATIRQCALGGMIGNNSCGARSLVYGKTGDHVHSLDCVLPDSAVHPLRPRARDALGTMPGRRASSRARCWRSWSRSASGILSRYPKVPRRVSGYNFDALLEDEELNLARLIVGSEGTLATVVEAELGLVPAPRRAALVLLSFPSASPRWTRAAILPEPGLSALEIVDSRVLQGARELFEFRPTARWPRRTRWACSSVEFSGDAPEEVAELAHDFAARAPRLPGAPSAGVFLSPTEQTAAWALRQAATGLLYRTTPPRHQAAGVRRGHGHPAGEAGRVHAPLRGDRAPHGTTTRLLRPRGAGVPAHPRGPEPEAGRRRGRMQAIAGRSRSWWSSSAARSPASTATGSPAPSSCR